MRNTRRLMIVVVVGLVAAMMPVTAAHALDPFRSVPVHRFYNQSNGSHFYTISAEEVAFVQKTYPDLYTYEGIAYYSSSGVIEDAGVNPVATPVPLHRFYNKKNGSHFYTISDAEKAYVEANFGAIYTYEGVAYHVLPSGGLGPFTPVYRFYNLLNGSHFYTASEPEMLFVRYKFPTVYRYEGIAFYAYGNVAFN